MAVSRVASAFEGCYETGRAAALAGVPVSTVYYWARERVVVPTISQVRPILWSYADLMALRIVYWLRHPKPGTLMPVEPPDEPFLFTLSTSGTVRRSPSKPKTVPASPMRAVRRALAQLEKRGIDLWSQGEPGHTSPLVVDRRGRIHILEGSSVQTDRGQGVMPEVLDLLGPFDIEQGTWGPDLRQPMPHLRIVPGRVSGEPHLAHSRLTTRSVVTLADRGFSLNEIRRLYPDESKDGLLEAIELEHRLAA